MSERRWSCRRAARHKNLWPRLLRAGRRSRCGGNTARSGRRAHMDRFPRRRESRRARRLSSGPFGGLDLPGPPSPGFDIRSRRLDCCLHVRDAVPDGARGGDVPDERHTSRLNTHRSVLAETPSIGAILEAAPGARPRRAERRHRRRVARRSWCSLFLRVASGLGRPCSPLRSARSGYCIRSSSELHGRTQGVPPAVPPRRPR